MSEQRAAARVCSGRGDILGVAMRVVMPLLLLSACFSPTFHDPTCGPAGECPDGLTCIDGVCRTAGTPDAEAPGDSGGGLDAEEQADAAPPDASTFVCAGWSALNVDPCDVNLPAPGEIAISGAATYDTDSFVLTSGGTSTPPHAVLSQTGGPMVTALNLTSLTITASSSLTVTGSRPLVIIVHGDATIAGVLDVASRRSTTTLVATPGPGADDNTICASSFGGAGGDNNGGQEAGGGGGGGGFGASGGDGGDGAGAGFGAKGPKGAQSGNTTLEPLRAGCAGGTGGRGGALPSPTDHGRGGGAIEITALGTITVSGTIAAGGSGGLGPAADNSGGGGGGSGGGILLDADAVIVMNTGKLCANGGAGGEGGDTIGGGDLGDDAACSILPALGGSMSSSGGNGGNGGSSAVLAGSNASNGGSGGGGGGGGGGVGRIRVRGRFTRTIDANAVVTPPAGS